MRIASVCSLFLVFFPVLCVPADEPAPSPVEFDSKLSFACREVTPKDFAAANQDRKIVEATLRISANFAIDEQKLDCIVYKLRVPLGIEIADYLPKTKLDTNIDGPIVTHQNTSARTDLVVSFEGGAKVGYRLPAVVDAEASLSGKRTDEKANEVSSGVQVRMLPPKQLIVAAGTENRGQTLCFKLRPFSQITLEGEKEFACLLAVPKDWTGACITLDCTAYLKPDRELAVRQLIGVGLYVAGDSDARARVEKLARDVVSPAEPAVVRKKPLTLPVPAEPMAMTLSCEKCAGVYKIGFPAGILSDARILGYAKKPYSVELKSDGTWEGNDKGMPTASPVNTSYKRGTWSIRDGKLTIAQCEGKVVNAVFGSPRGWLASDASIYADVKIQEFDEKKKTIYLEGGEKLEPVER
jgi:hypothetical protein